MLKKVNYTIEDATIAELLGVQNFSNDESAVLELVKNAYDAGSSNLDICFKNNQLVIFDNGIGMNSDDIEKNWMHVGKSSKGYTIADIDSNLRVLAGSKGVGRFALSRLGLSVTMISKKENEPTVCWKTDWNESFIDEVEDEFEHGTKIIISNLRERWTKKKLNNLIMFLSKTYNDDKMHIDFSSDEISCQISSYFPEAKVGVNCLSKITMDYFAKDKKLVVEVYSDEFDVDAEKYCPNIDLTHNKVELKIVDELATSKDIDIEVELSNKTEVEDLVEKIGDFHSVMLFNNKSTKADREKFLYKDHNSYSDLNGGIILYRNAFSISSYEGKKDWLGLGKRARKSPAAASHSTGAWRVRDNQLTGKVEIDKEENSVLQDLSNRQGLDENVYFQLFVSIIHIGLKQFERYRQGIIRAINTKNAPETIKDTSIIEKILKNRKLIEGLDDTIKEGLYTELSFLKKHQTEYKDQENKYKYDVRILNVLSTLGLKATSIAHEMENDRNAISEFTKNIVEALMEYNLWEIVNEEDKTRYAYKNIPSLIENNDKTNSKVLSFMDTMLSETEKQQFDKKWQSVCDILQCLKTDWENDYNWVNINILCDEDVVFSCAQDMIKVVFDNLILNSVQQNKDMNQLLISIKTYINEDMLVFEYSDNGKGLIEKYLKQPRLILEVHESSRKDGHGLGMWIVNNTVTMSGGEVIDIKGDGRFYIKFSVGGDF